HPAGRAREEDQRRMAGGVRGRGNTRRPGAAPRRSLRRSADPGARHGRGGRACQGRAAEDARRADQDVGQSRRAAPRRADPWPTRRRTEKAKIEGREAMARTAGVLAALALIPASALAQNGYSFLDAEKSAVHYSVATAKPAMSCDGVARLSWAAMTIL